MTRPYKILLVLACMVASGFGIAEVLDDTSSAPLVLKLIWGMALGFLYPVFFVFLPLTICYYAVKTYEWIKE